MVVQTQCGNKGSIEWIVDYGFTEWLVNAVEQKGKSCLQHNMTAEGVNKQMAHMSMVKKISLEGDEYLFKSMSSVCIIPKASEQNSTFAVG